MILLALLAAAAAPAAAGPPKPGPVEHVHEVVVEAIRNCPKAEPGEIAVCARDRGFAEKFRIQRLDPRFAKKEEEGLNLNGLVAGGPAGEGGCSRVGATGTSGCSLKDYNDWGAWKRQQQAEGRGFPW